tara:strand:- start:2917 stop:3381 length:465 start_codon:yes stop_codon:yes gene_type:complete
MFKTRLPYKQFDYCDSLSKSEREKYKKNTDEKIILKKTFNRKRRWSIHHLHKNKYFSYLPPLNTIYPVIKNDLFINKKSEIKPRKRSQSVIDIVYDITKDDINNCCIVYSELKNKSNNIKYNDILQNLYDNKRYKLFNTYDINIDKKLDNNYAE